MSKHRILNRTLTAWVVLLGLFISGCTQTAHSPVDSKRSVDVLVTNNLSHIWSVLRDAMGESDSFPKTFAELNQADLDASLFVCPGTGSRAGPMRSVEEWGDYIYIGNVCEGIPRTALIISPPANHGGNYGYVICIDGYLVRLPPDQIHTLVNEPWLMDTNASANNINYLKKRISIRVPKRLRPYYRQQS